MRIDIDSYNTYMDIKKLQFTDEEIEKKMRKSPTLWTIFNLTKNLSYLKDFKVGQVLVKRYLNDNKLATNVAGIPDKYIVVNMISGIPICKRLQANGKPGTGLYCPAEVDYERERFEEDPDCADAILLGVDYDPLEFPKKVAKARSKVMAHNNKITLRNVLDKHTKIKLDKRVHTLSSSIIAEQIRELLSKDGATVKLWRATPDNKDKKLVTFLFHRARDGSWEIHEGSIGKPVTTWSMIGTYSEVFVEEPKLLKEELEKQS
jgi:hypothetical protein